MHRSRQGLRLRKIEWLDGEELIPSRERLLALGNWGDWTEEVSAPPTKFFAENSFSVRKYTIIRRANWERLLSHKTTLIYPT
ncbi:hypothetical protein OLK001_08680 [Synechocystis sp. LKSZ1]